MYFYADVPAGKLRTFGCTARKKIVISIFVMQMKNFILFFACTTWQKTLIYYSAIAQRVKEIIRLQVGEREAIDGKEEMMVFAHFQWCGAGAGKIVATPASMIFIRDARGFRLRFG